MADLAVTAASVEAVFPDSPSTVIRNFTSLNGGTAGQSVFVDPTTGKIDLCDANAAGHEQFAGIMLRTVAASESVRVLMRGEVYGFDLSGINYWGLVYQGDTAGSLNDTASGTKTVQVGRVVPLNDSGKSKVLFISADMTRNW